MVCRTLSGFFFLTIVVILNVFGCLSETEGMSEQSNCLAEIDRGCNIVDLDHDGIINTEDNCLGVYNPDQADYDQDGYGDVCDTCPNIANLDQAIFETEEASCACVDFDKDGFFNGPGCPPYIIQDCEDRDPTIYPGAPEELCNGVDNDCDGFIDKMDICSGGQS